MSAGRPHARTKIITVFGSSRPREGDQHYELARALGSDLAQQGFTVCSGGYGGVMEGVSRGAKEAGGATLGVTAEFFRSRLNRWVDEEIHVKTWQDRLFTLIEYGSGYIACPSGTGTLVELAVVWEMLNKRVMRDKPFVALGDFWLPVIERVRKVEIGHGSSWGEAASRIIHFSADPAEAAEYLRSGIQSKAQE